MFWHIALYSVEILLTQITLTFFKIILNYINYLQIIWDIFQNYINFQIIFQIIGDILQFTVQNYIIFQISKIFLYTWHFFFYIMIARARSTKRLGIV